MIGHPFIELGLFYPDARFNSSTSSNLEVNSMNVTQLINKIPLPSFACHVDGTLVAMNEHMKDKLENFSETNVSHVFDSWINDHVESVVFAKRNGQSFIFIMCLYEKHTELYISVPEPLVAFLNELKESNRELSTIFENSYDGIYITDPKGKTLKTNTAIERITGIPKEYYIGKTVDDLIKRGILQTSVTHKVLEQKRRVTINQLNYAGKDTLMTGNPVFNEEGDIEKIVTNIRDLTELNEVHRELKKIKDLNQQYKRELKKLQSLTKFNQDVVIVSEKMNNIYDVVERIANVDVTVLILGETGAGKDVIAGEIYHKSDRSKTGEFIKVNCGAIPDHLLESELFGYESGAFTGANQKGKQGLFELAHNGVIFLDEIGELPSELQVKLLRVLQENEIQRIGATKPLKVNARVVAATNRDLMKMVKEGRFREDLFYRLNVIPIHVPPLRERRDDILPLVQHFLEKTNEKYNFKKEFNHELNEFFYYYSWPGNVRELANLIERLVLTTGNDLITIDDLPVEYQKSEETEFALSDIVSLKDAVELAEVQVLQAACKKYRTTYEIAKALRTSQATIVRKLKKYNLTIE
ncbi:sigma-54 interaction domain-containing protein [Pueribacillus sp. YX66]|uniref:sigma-54 interaction domain-containing protein n=1 Tax=Pueribacillus sp. YX66 TaxID=3229242 RepID=UPI00358D9A93